MYHVVQQIGSTTNLENTKVSVTKLIVPPALEFPLPLELEDIVEGDAEGEAPSIVTMQTSTA